MNRVIKFIRWFYPGLKIKRWISFLLIGVVIILISSRYRDNYFGSKVLFYFIYSVGLITLLIGVFRLMQSFFEAIYPGKGKDLIDIIYENRFLSKGPKLVAVGGGHGLSTLLAGLKEYTTNITAIVAVADEGGSSGRLRQEFGILPPGDIRNCLVSLAEAPQLMRDLFQYRFTEGGGIKGHSFGNLFITAMTQVSGSFKSAVEESSKVLAIRGKVLPSSLDKIRLKAEYTDGSSREGEDKIPQGDKSIKKIYLMPEQVSANPQVIEAINTADLILLGPGSLFTSILPNLLIKGISDAIAARSDALKLYVCNVMTQHGETDGYTAYDHVSALCGHAGKTIINSVLVNNGRLDQALLYNYAQEHSFPVIPDVSRIRGMGFNVFEQDVVCRSNYLHHDSHQTAKEIINIFNSFKRKCRNLNKR